MMRRSLSSATGINIEVRAKDENQRLTIRDALTRIPGIHHILEVEDVPFTDMHDIFEKALVQYRDQLEGKTFCVRVKRRGKHDFSSIDVERYVGGGLNQHIESACVKLTNPDVTVHLEWKDDRSSCRLKAATKVLVVSRSAPRKMCCRSFPVVSTPCFQLYVDALRLPRALLLL